MNNTHASYDVVVVGGGASGMMSAYCLALRGYKVLILEKNTRLGEKVRISGGGRCNITNAEYDTRTLLKKYGKAEPYLYSLFAQFGVKDTFTFFESRGVTLVVEEHKRAFPKSYNANDVVRVFEQGLKETRVTVRNGEPVKEVLHEDGSITGIRTEFGVYTAKHYIFATGGVSHKETGSTGDGFGWLAKLGHTVIPATPSIVPLAVVDDWVKVIAGSVLQDVKVTFFVDDKKQFSCKGNVLCTHFGISGPTILNVASKVGVILPAGTVTAHIDLFPSLDHKELGQNLLHLFDTHKNRDVKNVLREFFGGETSRGLLVALSSSVDMSKKVHSVTKEERSAIVAMCKSMRITIEGLMGFDRAVVADGGVPLDEVDMKTMRSLKVKNLSITGDLLNINRPSGGYSLQLCWGTGSVAGNTLVL